tara:strand:- start:9449 stop:10354 length:906 start_codon:yes stop_codon:yes gene_type:complete
MEENFLNNNPLTSKFKLLNYKKYITDTFPKRDLDLKKKYQVVIMAAGKGTRMNIHYPKPLFKLNYPKKKKTVLSNLIDVISSTKLDIYKINLVINEIDENYFENDGFISDEIEIIKLNEKDIKGTAFCLNKIKDFLSHDHDILLFWGDLAIIPSSYIFYSVLFHEKFNSFITMPTKLMKDPYVAFIRDSNGKFSDIFHSNENSQYFGYAEQDCSFFVLNKKAINYIGDFIKKEENLGKDNFDFVHYIPFCSKHHNIIGLPFADYKYITGINTIDKTKELDKQLNNYTKDEYERIFLNPWSL